MVKERENRFGNSGRRLLGTWRPVGPLAVLLNYFEAPEDCQRIIARRAGTLAGSKYLTMSTIQGVIEDSMTSRGLPDWSSVEGVLADIVHHTYRRNKL